MEQDRIVSEKHWRLFRGADGALCLGVLVGGIAMYELCIALSPEELARYEASGRAFLDDLAYDVAKHESAYAQRKL